MKEVEYPKRQIVDFFDYWEKRYLSAGYDQKEVARDFDNYKRICNTYFNETNGTEYKRFLLQMFIDELDK